MTEKMFKSFVSVTKAVDLDAGIFEAMISTESVDRQGDIVRAAGAQLENYLRNPVVLWAHDYSQPPVARALSVEIIPGVGLKSTFQFPEWGVSEQADTVRRLWAGGFLNATSIGFIPMSMTPIDPDRQWGPQDITSWEMLEYSVVPVPANQNALRLAMKSLAGSEEKRGRVLSASNEKRLKEAADLINGVLVQLGEAEPQEEQFAGSADPDTEPPAAKSNTDPTSNDANDAELMELIKTLVINLNGAL